ncbi:MAG: electron transfer flavoprotein subunit alpha/FixB family protein [Anaerolineales bacterium]|nr:electron transfer flavoprotein subunit alpha/FixB family protein [Anaerolineales bacterium]
MDLADLSALLGEDASAVEHRDIWTVVPAGSPTGTPTLMAEARRLADGLGCYVHAVVGDAAQAAEAITFGADRAHVTLDATAYLMTQHPEYVLLLGGQETAAAQLAQRLGAGLITGTRTLEIDPDTRALRGTHAVYGGDYALDLEVTTQAKVATVDVTEWPAPYADPGRTGKVITSDLAAPEAVLVPLGAATPSPPAWPPLSKARTIVAVGRGVGGEAGLALAQALAEKLGAEFAGDRSARDSGWVDAAHEVGVTGQEVAPNLYLAFGILGDTIHNAAISRARRVLAVHVNPEAPIFKVADVAVVAEPAAVIAALLSQAA